MSDPTLQEFVHRRMAELKIGVKQLHECSGISESVIYKIRAGKQMCLTLKGVRQLAKGLQFALERLMIYKGNPGRRPRVEIDQAPIAMRHRDPSQTRYPRCPLCSQPVSMKQLMKLAFEQRSRSIKDTLNGDAP